MKNKKIYIAIEEMGAEKFNIFLTGDIERLNTIPQDDMSPAEFWGSQLFQICLYALTEAGAIKNVSDRGAH